MEAGNFDNTAKDLAPTPTSEADEGASLSETEKADFRWMRALIDELDLGRLSGEGGFDRSEDAA